MIRSISTVIGGQIAGQFVALAALPVLTRMFMPGAFGDFAIFSAWAWIVGVFATLQLEHLIVLQRSEMRARALVAVMLVSGVVVAFVALAVSAVVARIVEDNALIVSATPLWPWFVPTVILIAWTQGARSLAVREGAFSNVSFSGFVSGIGIAFGSIGYGFAVAAGDNAAGLAAGQFLGLLLSSIVLSCGKTQRWMRCLRRPKYVAELAWRLRREAATLVPTHAAKTIYARLPVVTVGALGMSNVTGYFALIERVIGVPTRMVGQAVGQVIRNRIGAMGRAGTDISMFYRRVLLTNVVLGVLGYGVAIAFAPFAIVKIFGPSWAEAGYMAQILLIVEMVNYVFHSLEDTAVIIGLNRYRLRWQGAQLVCHVALLTWIVFVGMDPAHLLWAFVVIRCTFVMHDCWTHMRVLDARRAATSSVVRKSGL